MENNYMNYFYIVMALTAVGKRSKCLEDMTLVKQKKM